MATDRVKRLRCSGVQEAAWLRAAGGEGGFSAWARRALDEAAALEAALVREAEGAGEGGLTERDRVEAGVKGPVSRLFERR